ncbi:MAG: hypothetical protein BM564_05775 [Bacteroidetes bacterium MedPE-SWsnd-G2]|nr:MAG: hypothetical protein BM564_05775 [Bacteroidetes bacterium MedPE-SWsnd-G2]
MDELELLKKDWKNQTSEYPKLSYDEIYKMILKKSSSIVKWILIISVLEFAFWTLMSFALKDSKGVRSFDELGAENILIPMTVIGYAILIYFIYLFFRNYKSISATDNVKILMENILKTRKTVKQYVAFNLIYLVIATFVALGIEIEQNEVVRAKIEEATANGDALMFYAKIFFFTIVALGAAIAVLLVFYYLVYGLLLKRLNLNYKELKKLND